MPASGLTRCFLPFSPITPCKTRESNHMTCPKGYLAYGIQIRPPFLNLILYALSILQLSLRHYCNTMAHQNVTLPIGLYLDCFFNPLQGLRIFKNTNSLLLSKSSLNIHHGANSLIMKGRGRYQGSGVARILVTYPPDKSKATLLTRRVQSQ